MPYLPNTKPYLLTHTRLLVALMSLLLSFVLIAMDDIINKDGILYLETASAFLSSGISVAFEHFNWPFYPVLIASLHQLTDLPLEMSAYLLTTAFFILLTDSLYLMCRKILPSPQHVLVGMLIFLVFYSLNDYRDFIIRDPGYWAFSSLGLFFFMSFLDKPRWRTAFYWQFSMFAAILFRIEATFLLLALPLYTFYHFSSRRDKTKHYVQLSVLPLLGLLIAIFSQPLQSIMRGSDRLGHLMRHNLSELLQHFDQKADQIVQLLPSFTHDYGFLILFTGLLGMITFIIIEAIHIGYFGLYIAARWHQPAPHFPHHALLRYALALNGLILIAFSFLQFFMITRYCIMFSLILLLLMLPAITHYIVTAWYARNKFILFLLTVILLVSLYSNISYSVSKAYIKETALWASEHLPQDSLVATDDPFIAYYFNIAALRSERLPITLLQSKEDTVNYDQLIYVKKKKRAIAEEILTAIQSRQSIYSQQNKRGDMASIYK